VLELAATPVPLGALLAVAAAELGRSGVADPRREAVRLWGAVAGLGSGEVWRRRDRPPDTALLPAYRGAVARRRRGEPFAYAVGRAAFRTLELAVDARVLIPRPETEGLVELVLRRAGGGPGRAAADVGTGSGCIALALAVEGRFERVIATDADPGAVALARENVARVAPPTPVEVLLGDWLAPLAGRRCRVVVANPPYLTEAEWQALEPAVRDWEPRRALVGGLDGLAATRLLLAGARDVLEPGGLLALEIDERRAGPVDALARVAGWRPTVHCDLSGRPRYVLAV
jgi:release factor glutamine methyltransferase